MEDNRTIYRLYTLEYDRDGHAYDYDVGQECRFPKRKVERIKLDYPGILSLDDDNKETFQPLSVMAFYKVYFDDGTCLSFPSDKFVAEYRYEKEDKE